VTVAFAVDFLTAGEKLTHKAAGEKYIGLPISSDLMTADHALKCARQLYAFIKARGGRRLNVAGNGIYALTRHGVSQSDVNLFVASVICKVHEHHPLSLVVSGGQTGVDVAGGVAGVVAAIPVEMTLPHGFLQRGADKIDKVRTLLDVTQQVTSGAEQVRGRLMI